MWPPLSPSISTAKRALNAPNMPWDGRKSLNSIGQIPLLPAMNCNRN
jgi:hypothetical protein